MKRLPPATIHVIVLLRDDRASGAECKGGRVSLFLWRYTILLSTTGEIFVGASQLGDQSHLR